MNQRTVLYFDHTATLGGGEIALLKLISAIDRQRFRPLVVLGMEGKFQTRLEEAGIEVHIIPMASNIAKARKDTIGATTLLSATKLRECWNYARRLANFIIKNRVDLLYTNSLKADLIGALAARIAHIPLIWHVRDRISSDYLPSIAATGIRVLSRWLPDHIITNSKATRETLGQIDQRKVTVVYDGLSSPNFPPAPLPSGPPVIGILGRISPWKGQHVFLNAAAKIRQSFPRAQFRIIGAPLFGEDAYERDLHAIVRKLGLEQAVEFTGFQDDVKRAIEQLTVMIHASTLPEPFGQVVFEAMYYSRPVVATRAGGVPEIVEDNVTGILVPMDDANAIAHAVESLLAAPECARQMGTKGRERVLHYFPIKKSARKVESIYEELLQLC
jgi:glycosyltransferase involved in cell wall biosynthesis